MQKRYSILFCILVTMNCFSATDVVDFTVSATVVNDCDISATNLTFNDYDPDSGNGDATSTITATCTNSTAYTVGLNAGIGSGATTTTRKMTCASGSCSAGSDVLNYSLYKESSHSQVWGNSGGDLVSGTGNGSAQNLTVYGRIFSGQTVTAGNYSDTITATLTY